MITRATRYAGYNPLRWLLVLFTIWSAFAVFAWRVALNWLSILLMALLLCLLLVGVAMAAGWLMGQVLIWAGLI